MSEIDEELAGFKELGSLQEKILFYVAENPNQNAQEIQKGLEYPSEQYGNINKSTKGLQKLKFLKSKKGVSEKKVKIKLYSCTENGVFYVLARNPKANIIDIINLHKEEYPIFVPFIHLFSAWGKEKIAKFFENSFQFVIMRNKEGEEKAVSYLLMKVQLESADLKPKYRKKIAKEILKLFPTTRKTMQEIRDALDELLED